MKKKYLEVSKLFNLHSALTASWHRKDYSTETYAKPYDLISQNHWQNFNLWQAEDRARREDKGFEFVYTAKREIDTFNQLRNNLIEAIDVFLFENLQPSQEPNCPFNSETPAMIIDRLSILTLKKFYMEQQLKRQDVDFSHIEKCKAMHHQLNLQHSCLLNCLDVFLSEIYSNKRSFFLYKQFKMYNDKNLNPQLYNASCSTE